MNFSTPIQNLVSEEIFPGNLNQVLNKELQFYNVDIMSDNGFFFSNPLQYKSIQSYRVIDTSYYFQNPPYIASVRISITNFKETYMRTYQKLQTALAQTGGMTNIVMILFTAINTYFSGFDFVETMSKAIDEKLVKKGKGKSSGNKNEMVLITPSQDNNRSENLSISENKKEKISLNGGKKKLEPDYVVKNLIEDVKSCILPHISFSDRIAFLFICCFNSKKEMMERFVRVKSKIQQAMDYKSIIKVSMLFQDMTDPEREMIAKEIKKIIKIRRNKTNHKGDV
jgi:hypothetical protein